MRTPRTYAALPDHPPARPLTFVGISPKQLAQMEARLQKPRSRSAPVAPAAVSPTQPQRWLGIDPSLRGTGYGVIEMNDGKMTALTHGTVRCPASWEQSRCLARIAGEIREVIRTTTPTVCIIEGLFFAQNIQTAIIMGQARGAALAVIAEADLPIYELAPRKVKQAVVGYGGAGKLAVARMVQRQLGMVDLPAPDAADALAVALAFAQSAGRHQLALPKRI